MAVRLQLKLGAVTEQDQLADSPDAIVVVEPSVGSVARSKGNLYLLVSSRLTGNRAREATRMVADTIRNEYYYDESAGIRQCLVKVLGVANKRLAHQKDRYGMGHAADDGGPVGVAVAVVRGRELYVATVGPAEAYLIRQARLSTLPDPNRDRGLPVEELEPEVWRGELSVGDSLCLVSANIVAKIGTDALKDALVTLHPQSAIEHLHARFVAADGKGSDGALAFEANEVGATYKSKALVPVRPAEPLAGAPDKSPIPLADTVTSGAAAIGAGATRAKSAAGNGFQRAIWRIQDLLPRRKTGARKVTGTASRMEMQRRAAVALLAFVVVAGALGLGVYAVGGQPQRLDAIKSLTAAESAFDAAKADLAGVSGPGVNLIDDDPNRALELLNHAYQQLDLAENAGYPIEQIAPLRATALAGLDRIYQVTSIKSSPLYTFPKDKPVQLAGLVRGPDGAPYVLDTASKTVWRIDLAKKTATPVLKSGQRTSSGRVADPKFITVGGPDVLVLDTKNQLWRWRPANNSGRGSLVRIPVKNSASWGDDVKDISTFVANFDAAFYKLYVVDPSEQNILVLDPANDGSGYPEQAAAAPADRPARGRHHRPHDRRRHLRRGERPGRPRDPGVRVVAAAPVRHAAPTGERVHDALVADPRQRQPEPPGRRAVRVRRREPPDRRVQQVRREVPGPVPAPGRRHLVGRPQGHRRAAGRRRRRAVDAVVDLEQGAEQRPARAGARADPVGVPGRELVGQAPGEAGQDAEAGEDQAALTPGPRPATARGGRVG